jgi:UDP-2,3-diacylglucosamine pyrophosphatase LpxH
MQLNKKAQAIKDHFYSVNLTRVDFERENFASYGFESQANFHRHLTRMGISVKSRSEHFKKTRPAAVIESFDLSEVDNFGIEESLGKEYTSLKITDDFKKVGIISDIHVPYHSLQALTCAIKHLREQKIDALVMLGDVFDFYGLSRHEKEKDMRDVPREIEMGRNFLQKIRDIFPQIPIYYKMGNHENRWQRYLNEQAEEFSQLHEMQFEYFFRLDKLNMIFVPDWQGMEIGDLLLLHGHELMAGGMNPSQSTFNKTFCNTLIGHVHRTTSTTKKNGFKEFFHTYSMGCLTQLSPKYYPFAQHNHGFALVEINDGKTKVQNIMIKDGKIV